MKKFLLKTVDITLTIIMILSALYAVFNLTMSFLPAEIQTTVYTALRMSTEYIATFSISATVNAVILISSKLLQVNLKMRTNEKLANSEKVIQSGKQSNNAVLEKVNELISNINILQDLNNAVLSVQKVTTERNIKASGKLVRDSEKQAYKDALKDIEKAKGKLKQVDNIQKVFEREEVIEIEKIVEKVVDPLDGRV